MSYTPGPWIAYKTLLGGDADINRRIIRNDSGTEVAHLNYHMHRWSPEMEDNARLIAAAPELFEALQTISGWSRCQCTETHGDNPNCAVLIAENAIAKATHD